MKWRRLVFFIEVHRKPEEDSYKETFTVYEEEEISAVSFPDVTFKVADFVG